MKDEFKMPIFFIAIISICLTVLGSAMAMHFHEFMKQESYLKESTSKIVS